MLSKIDELLKQRMEQKSESGAIKKCEMFGCLNKGLRLFQIAPGTNVWLCYECALTEGTLDDNKESFVDIK